MASRKLAEYTSDLITDELKASLPTALAQLRSERADPVVSTEPPKRYFNFEMAKGFETPAVFVIVQDMDMRNTTGPNYISAEARVIASVLIEDRIKDRLVKKAWRYQAAMHKVLHLTSLTSDDGKVKLIVKVERCNFSPEFSDTQDPNATQSVFRKEVSLELKVEHYEELGT